MSFPVIVIAGPTACNKTKTSIEICKQFNGEVVSADSMQIYKYMDIGTAKPSKEEQGGIPHHLIDELYPDEAFNVCIFKEKGLKAIEDIKNRGRIPVITGGTGFYIDSLIRKNDFSEMENDYKYRQELESIAKLNGNVFLHDMLLKIDPVSYKNIHPNNVKKVVRALEYFKLAGEPISVHNEREREKDYSFKTLFFVLSSDRESLYNRIENRIDKMIDDGLFSEVEKLLQLGYSENLVSMQGIGYKELVPAVKGELSLEEAVLNLKQNTRHFAKRQLTWFRNKSDGIWIDVLDNDSIYEIKKMIEKNYFSI